MATINYGTGVQPGTRGDIEMLGLLSGLPAIRGRWYFVDPTSGAAGASGESINEAVSSIEYAYNRCVSGAGDGIAVLSRGTGTASQTTSYLTQELAWSKHGITVFGVAAPVSMFGRARVASKTIVSTVAMTAVANTSITRATGSFVADGWVAGMKFITNVDAAAITVVTVSALTITVTGTLTVGAHTAITSVNVNLMTISGSNNRFYNLHCWNGGTNALEIGGVVVTGARNYFEGCHIAGGAGAATTANNYSLKLDTTAEENTFSKSTIGSNSFSQGDNAAAEIVLNGVVKRNRFYDCEIMAMVSAGTAHGAVKSVGTSGGTGTVFKSCLFDYSLSTTTPAAVHLVSGAVDKVVLQDCMAVKVTAWGTYVYANMIAPTAAAGGGLATTA